MRSYSSSPTTLISGLCHWTGNPHVGETRLLRLCACACTWKAMVRIRSWNTKWRLVFHPIQIMRWCQQNPDRRKECYLSLALPLPLSLSLVSLSLSISFYLSVPCSVIVSQCAQHMPCCLLHSSCTFLFLSIHLHILFHIHSCVHKHTHTHCIHSPGVF